MKFLIFTFVLMAMGFTHAQESVKMLAWNVYMLPKPIAFSFQPERTKLIAEKFKSGNYDVLIFTELFSPKALSSIVKDLRSVYPYQARLKGKFLRLSSGILILSKFPAQVLNSLYYSDCAYSDCLASKGALLVEISTPKGKKFQVAGTHLQAWSSLKSKSVRQSQFQQIKSLFVKEKKANIPQILVGDLNIDGRLETEYSSSLKILEMESSPLDGDIPFTNGFYVGCYKTPGDKAKGEWLDHFFLHKNQTQASITHKRVVPFRGIIKGKECDLSDHYALEATLHL
jgi:endonuclease/exonuclease/phosphatase family metal-dependent hydrolase